MQPLLVLWYGDCAFPAGQPDQTGATSAYTKSGKALRLGSSHVRLGFVPPAVTCLLEWLVLGRRLCLRQSGAGEVQGLLE